MGEAVVLDARMGGVRADGSKPQTRHCGRGGRDAIVTGSGCVEFGCDVAGIGRLTVSVHDDGDYYVYISKEGEKPPPANCTLASNLVQFLGEEDA